MKVIPVDATDTLARRDTSGSTAPLSIPIQAHALCAEILYAYPVIVLFERPSAFLARACEFIALKGLNNERDLQNRKLNILKSIDPRTYVYYHLVRFCKFY